MDLAAEKFDWLSIVPREVSIIRPGEPHDHAIDQHLFLKKQNAGEYYLSWYAHNIHYGIDKQKLNLILGPHGQHWGLINGARRAVNQWLEASPKGHVIEIQASLETRRLRLASRERENMHAINQRLNSAPLDSSKIPKENYHVVDNNQDINQSFNMLSSIIKKITGIS